MLGVRGALQGALWCSIEPVLWLKYFISLPPEMCYGPGLSAARLTLPLRAGTPRRLTRLFQTWFCYLPNLIHRSVGKMYPSRVLVLNLTTPFSFVLLLTLVSPHSYGGRETVFEPFERSTVLPRQGRAPQRGCL